MWCGDPKSTGDRSRAALYLTAMNEAWRYVRSHPYRFSVRHTEDTAGIDRAVCAMVTFPLDLQHAIVKLQDELRSRRWGRV